MFSEFKAFVMRGNVLDLAVAVIIGAAFGKIVTSMTDDLIMPVIGFISGGADFSSHFVRLGAIPANFAGNPESYADLKKAGVAMFGWGEFLTQTVNFVILAFIIFMLVRTANKFMTQKIADADPADIALLKEIRDELKARPKI